MSRVKLTTNNSHHTPLKNGEEVEGLIAAAAKGSNQMKDFLAGRNPNEILASGKISALHALARAKSGNKADRAALVTLLANGMEVDLLNYRNETPLMRVAATGSWWLAKPLLDAGASIDIKDSSGRGIVEIAKIRFGRHPGEERGAGAEYLGMVLAVGERNMLEQSTPRVSAKSFRSPRL